MGLKIVNPSRGTVDPSTASEPTGVKALDPTRFSLRDTSAFVDLSQLQTSIGYAKTHAKGTDRFESLLPRTRLASLAQVSAFSSEATISVGGGAVTITKTDTGPQPSTYVTPVDASSQPSNDAMVSGIINVLTNPAYANNDPDPMGPVLGLEHGPRRTALYVFFLRRPDGTKVLRVCGPKVAGVRFPDVYVPFDWTIGATQFVLFWSEMRQRAEVYRDDGGGSGGIANATLLCTIPISQFQAFDSLSVRSGGDGDIVGVYGVEGTGFNSAAISSIAISIDVGSPFVNGARPGAFITHLMSDQAMGFRGSVDPTRNAPGTWFVWPTNVDPAGAISPSSAGYVRLIKTTAGKNFFVYRQEPGLERLLAPTLDGFSIEFKCNSVTSGATSFETDTAIIASDGTTIFQLDFLYDGVVRNLGLLRRGGDPGTPADHLLAPAPINWQLERLRLVVNARRGVIEIFDVTDLTTPLGSWPFDRAALPQASLYPQITGGFIGVGFVVAGAAVGNIDIYDIKYSYIFEAYETRDGLFPDQANPAFTDHNTVGGPLNLSVMPGVLPLPYSSGIAGVFLDDSGLMIETNGGEVSNFRRAANIDANRGGAVEAWIQITDWHPGARTGVFLFLDDGVHTYLLSFVETETGRYVAIPLSAGLGQFQEIVGDTGDGPKLSRKIDWSQPHVYRLERRPLDGVYLFIDNESVLVLPEAARYSFPASQFGTPTLGFGHLTDEGATSVWKFVRDVFGSGFEISTRPNQSPAEIQSRASGARAIIVVSAGG